MPFPDWVEAQKKQGYEIKKIGDGYYMYERKSRWDKDKKKPVKVTGEYIGVVTPEGIIPRKKRYDDTIPIFTIEYGATAFIKNIAGDILKSLCEHFDKNTAQMIWVISMLRLIAPSPFQMIEERYQTSWMSKILPDLLLSKSSITDLIDRVGSNRASCAAFMRDTLPSAPYMLIDRSRAKAGSEFISRVLPNFNKSKKYLPQINQIYLVAVSESGDGMPGFYRNVADNMPDISAFELTLEDAGLEMRVILTDNGVALAGNFEGPEYLEPHLKYAYQTYKNRSKTELLFETLCDIGEQDAWYVQDNVGFEAWTFLGHVTMMCAFRILALLRERNLFEDWTLEGLLNHLSGIHKVLVANEWRTAETTEKTQELISSLSFDLNQT